MSMLNSTLNGAKCLGSAALTGAQYLGSATLTGAKYAAKSGFRFAASTTLTIPVHMVTSTVLSIFTNRATGTVLSSAGLTFYASLSGITPALGACTGTFLTALPSFLCGATLCTAVSLTGIDRQTEKYEKNVKDAESFFDKAAEPMAATVIGNTLGLIAAAAYHSAVTGYNHRYYLYNLYEV